VDSTASRPGRGRRVEWLVGVDEAGRGPVAGPLVVCAFATSLGEDAAFEGRESVVDSKRITSHRKREHVYETILSPLVADGIAAFSVIAIQVEDIDRDGIQASWDVAVTRAVNDVLQEIDRLGEGKLGRVVIDGPVFPRLDRISPRIEIDRHRFYWGALGLKLRGVPIAKADALFWYVSAASIVAKVHRDRQMIELGQDYPQYEFEKHKGYGTLRHSELIVEHGLVPGIHRRAFVPKAIRATAQWCT